VLPRFLITDILEGDTEMFDNPNIYIGCFYPTQLTEMEITSITVYCV